MKINLNDTIVACATKISKQAISIIRLSGPKSIKIANNLFNKNLNLDKQIQIKKIFDNKNIIDEALILYFPKGKSFTKEDTIEIHCHGGVLLTKKILSLLIFFGARPAQPGEFMQRAYINGNINLLQAESINNLIESKNELALKMNANSLTNKNNKNILSIKFKIIDLISKIQTSIDYPDYDDIEGSTNEDIIEQMNIIINEINCILDYSKRFNYINSGIRTLIIGETNVGKSSLLNALICEEKAIVTNIEGTTRDIVEGELNFENFTLNLIDTAGIRDTKNKIEKIGIEKSLSLIDSSDLILFIINKGKINNEVYQKIKNKNHIVVLNKSDLLDDLEINNLKLKFKNLILTSAIKKDVKNLLNEIEKMFNNEELLECEIPILSNLEHIEMFKKILNMLIKNIDNLKIGLSVDLINIDFYEILSIINNMLGIYDADEEVIDNIFRKYCLGK